jgi:guanylate kinase
MASGYTGKLIVISAPSGAGKTTIAREILKRNPSLEFSVSATTRPMRMGEEHGRDYFFLTREEFERRVHAGEFVEWEEIYGNLYGTLRSELEPALRNGRHLLFDLDVKGGLSIKRQYPDALLIFIEPPSMEVLRQRLQNRRTEDAATFARRMERVAMEMEAGKAFDRHCVNDELARAVEEVQALVQEYLTT